MVGSLPLTRYYVMNVGIKDISKKNGKPRNGCWSTDSYEKVIAMLIGSFKRYDPRWEAIQALKAAVEK